MNELINDAKVIFDIKNKNIRVNAKKYLMKLYFENNEKVKVNIIIKNGLVFFKYIIQKYKINLNNKNINVLIRYFNEKGGKEFILTFLYQRQMSNIS